MKLKITTYKILLILCLSACGGGTSKEQASANKAEEKKEDVPAEEKKPEEEPEEKLAFNEEKAQRILGGYFQKYAERKFLALKDYYAEEVELFITLKNIKPEDVSKTAKDFFKDKTNIYYNPDFSRLNGKVKDGMFVTTLPIEMVWSKNTTGQDYTENEKFYSRSASVMLELKLDKDYKIVSYKEKEIIRPQYKLLQDLTAQSAATPELELELKKGTVVTDNFEKEFGNIEASRIKVVYKGKSYWIPEYEEGFGRGGKRLIERVE